MVKRVRQTFHYETLVWTDPKNVGYSSAQFDGAFEFRTDQPGNSTLGHEFNNKPCKGVIGPELSDEERWAIIEYLKTL